MRKVVVLLLFACSILVTAGVLQAAQVEAPADCNYCGMNRNMFSRSRMLITYEDGSSTGTCSINCAGVDSFANKGKKVSRYEVGDYNSGKLLDAKKAVWVIGGKKRGVMTRVAKWAFADKKSANAFIKENGGKLSTFDGAMKATLKELADEESSQSTDHGSHGGHGH